MFMCLVHIVNTVHMHITHLHENFNEDAKKNPNSIITFRPHLHFFPLDVEFVFLL